MFGVGDQRVDGVDAGVEVVLDGVEVAVVVVGDLGRDVALGDLVDIVGGDVQRPDDRVERVVHALDDLAVVALMLGGVGAGGKTSFHGGLGQRVGIGHQRADVILEQHQPLVDLIVLGSFVHLDRQIAIGDALHIGDERFEPAMHAVDGLLHLLVVALAGDLDPFSQVSSADQAQHAVAFTDGDEDGIQHDVHTAQHFGIGALELLRFATLGKLALLGGFGQPQQFFLQGQQHPDNLDQALGNGVVFGADVDLHRKVAGCNGLGGVLPAG